jgi:uncharacterized protein with HEPN domain
MRSRRERLPDILEAIGAIEKYEKQGYDTYLQNELIQGWMILQLQRVGQAVARLSEAVQGQCPDIPWQDIVGMRNLLIHDYFGINPSSVWTTVIRDVPVLKACVNQILAEMEQS